VAKNKSNEAVAEVVEQAAPAVVENTTLTFRTMHPKNRCSYGVAGNAGIVVFDLNLFAGSEVAGFTPPATITVDVLLKAVRTVARVDKAEAQAARAAEKAAKAQERVEAARIKAEEKAAKAKAALEAAQARVAAAQAAAPATE
jgi:hypothetical protein